VFHTTQSKMIFCQTKDWWVQSDQDVVSYDKGLTYINQNNL
jgi:hypothetical protein